MKRITIALIAVVVFIAAVTFTAKTYVRPLSITPAPTIDVIDTVKFPKVDSPIEFIPLYRSGIAKFKLDDQTTSGTINSVQTDVNGVVRVGGEFKHGTFCFAIEQDSATSGIVMLPAEGICYILESTKTGQAVVWVKKKLSDVVCVEMPPISEGAATNPTAPSVVITQGAVPIMDSRPSAKVVLFIDFIGGMIQDPLWNGGKAFNAQPAMYTLEQIKIAYAVAAERYSAFNVNVTTDVQKYIAAPAKSKMRVVMTTTNFMAGYGGYAFIGSLKYAGSGIYSPSIPCFAFVTMVGSAKNAGEVAAHELGHTFGLLHDGTKSATYYTGQGNWAPVMGSAYSKSVVQWSKGEYTNANNFQDDISTIAGTTGVGYVTSSNQASPTILGGTINATDVISNAFTSRFFQVTVTTTGTMSVSVKTPLYSGLNAAVEIRDTYGLTVLAKNNPLNDTNASVSTAVKPGRYVIKVYGEGEGDVKATGYTSYGSVGDFILTGTVTSGTLKAGTVAAGAVK